MRDAVTLNQRGVTTVTICQESFLNEALRQAELLNAAGLPLVVMPVVWDEEAFRREATAIGPRVAAVLTGREA